LVDTETIIKISPNEEFKQLDKCDIDAENGDNFVFGFVKSISIICENPSGNYGNTEG
jgi:hypothetical protein